MAHVGVVSFLKALSWKFCWRRPSALLGEFLLLHLPSLHYICIVWVALGRQILFVGGCFAAVPVWRMLCRRHHVGSSLLRADVLPS